MVIDILRQEHRNIETLLLVLERELGVFARGERPDYEVVHAVIAYFHVYPDACHHPLEGGREDRRSRGRSSQGRRTFAPGRAGSRECTG